MGFLLDLLTLVFFSDTLGYYFIGFFSDTLGTITLLIS